MDLIYFAKVDKFTTDNYEDVKASLYFNGKVYIITLTDKFFEIEPLSGLWIYRFKLVEAKDKLVKYLSNVTTT